MHFLNLTFSFQIYHVPAYDAVSLHVISSSMKTEFRSMPSFLRERTELASRAFLVVDDASVGSNVSLRAQRRSEFYINILVHLYSNTSHTQYSCTFFSLQIHSIFPPTELSARQTRLRDIMQQHDASVCLLTSRANVTYFTGFVPRNNEHLHCASLVTHDDVITLTAADVTELSVWAASGMHVDGRAASAYMRDYFASVGSVLASFRERIAVDCDVRAQRFLARVRQEAEGETKPSGSDRVRNVAAQIMRMRRTKSGHEVEVLRNAVHSAHVGAEAALVAIKEGVGEFKVTMHASRAMVRSIAQFYRRCDVSDSESKTSQVTWLDTSFY